MSRTCGTTWTGRSVQRRTPAEVIGRRCCPVTDSTPQYSRVRGRNPRPRRHIRMLRAGLISGSAGGAAWDSAEVEDMFVHRAAVRVCHCRRARPALRSPTQSTVAVNWAASIAPAVSNVVNTYGQPLGSEYGRPVHHVEVQARPGGVAAVAELGHHLAGDNLVARFHRHRSTLQMGEESILATAEVEHDVNTVNGVDRDRRRVGKLPRAAGPRAVDITIRRQITDSGGSGPASCHPDRRATRTRHQS